MPYNLYYKKYRLMPRQPSASGNMSSVQQCRALCNDPLHMYFIEMSSLCTRVSYDCQGHKSMSRSLLQGSR
jgi:hypothetical protein